MRLGLAVAPRLSVPLRTRSRPIRLRARSHHLQDSRPQRMLGHVGRLVHVGSPRNGVVGHVELANVGGRCWGSFNGKGWFKGWFM